MKVSTEKAPDSQVILTIEVEPSEFERSVEEAFKRLQARAVVPGFRKGKAPRTMIERYFGRSAVEQDAIDTLAPKVVREAIQLEKINYISEPRFEVTQIDPLIVKATMDVEPVIDLGAYQELVRVEPAPAVVEEGAVDAVLQRLRAEHAVWEPTSDAVTEGALVTITATIMCDGEKVTDVANQSYVVSTTRQDPLPGFAAELIGMTAESTKTFVITVPEDAENRELAGKTFEATVTVLDIKTQRLPELDDDFAKTVARDLDTLDALRERIAKNLQLQAEATAIEKTKEAAMQALVEIASVDVPSSMIMNEIDSMLRDQEEALRRQGMTYQQYLQITGKSMDDVVEELRPEARERAKRRLLLTELAKAEGITVTTDEINDEIADMIRRSGSAAANMAKLLDQPRARETVERNLKVRRALARLVAIATEGRMI
ncbi:MAG: trigger factor, partial [Dehalococcoidia bacterium]|nr:trigger factor [Dehalococcoidia bacterium]